MSLKEQLLLVSLLPIEDEQLQIREQFDIESKIYYIDHGDTSLVLYLHVITQFYSWRKPALWR